MDVKKAVAVAGPVVGVAVALVGAPVALAAVGFTKVGVVAGSMAAAAQTPATVAGGWFAACQSAGVLGLAAKTTIGIGATACGAVWTGAAALWPK